MQLNSSFKQRFSHFMKVLYPIIIYNIASYSAQVLDTMMTGKYSAIHLAGVATAVNIWWPFFALMTGTVAVLTPIVSHHYGAKRIEELVRDTRQFMYIGVFLIVILYVIALLGAEYVMSRMDLSAELHHVALGYLHLLSLGIIPIVLFGICRAFLDGLGMTRLSMGLMLCLVPLNIVFNYILIYGKMGFPQLGGMGAGLGTSCAYWVMLGLIILVLQYHPKLKVYNVLQFERPDWSLIKPQLIIGIPLGLANFVEVAIFAVVGLFMTQYTDLIVAAHQAAMNFTGIIYSIPSSIASALTIVVSYELGRQNIKEAHRYIILGIVMSMLLAFVTMIILLFERERVASFYGEDPAFVQLTVQFLGYGILFQFSDALNAPVQGVLRGYKDTAVPFVLATVAYWGIGLFSGIALTHWTTLGPFGYWAGLIIGLFMCGILLLGRLLHVIHREQTVIEMEDY